MHDRDPLNLFSPYERLPPGHENQLTRALLLLLRMSPLVHAEWLQLVQPGHRLGALPIAEYRTQRHAVRESSVGPERAALVSVFLAPEVPISGGGQVFESDRQQVLDAIIDYGGEVVTVVENKVYDADDLQARRINVAGARVQLVDGQEVVLVLWRDFLERVMGVLERRLVGGAEARLLDDFLTYVEDHFPTLGPYRSLALCRRAPSRVDRRLRQILKDATGIDATPSVHGSYVATSAGATAGANAYLRAMTENPADDIAIELALYPADTLTQAQAFYAHPKTVDAIRTLATEDGWEVRPNFHFGHMARGFCWTTGEVSIDDYLAIWQAQVGATRQVRRDEWDDYWNWLVETRIALRSDRTQFARDFDETERQSATPRPGLSLTRRWTIGDAERLDADGRLALDVQDSLRRAVERLDPSTRV